MSGHLDARTGDAPLGWRIRLLLGCYPPWWRTRYDDEMRDTVLALRSEGRSPATSSRDLLRGAVAAWFAADSCPGEDPMTDPSRRLVPRTALGLLLFVLAGSGFAKVIEDPSFRDAARHHWLLGWSIGVITLAALAAALLILAATAQTVVAIVRGRTMTRWRDLAPLLAVPLSGAAVLLTLAAVRPVVADTPVHQPRHLVAFAVLALVTLAGGVATTVACTYVALRAPDTRAVRLSRRIAILAVGVLTGVSALAALAWTLASASETPTLMRASDGLVATPTWASLLPIVVALTVAAVLCGQSARSAFRRETEH